MHLCFILSKPAKPSISKFVQLGEQAVYTKDSRSCGLRPATLIVSQWSNPGSHLRSKSTRRERRCEAASECREYKYLDVKFGTQKTC